MPYASCPLKSVTKFKFQVARFWFGKTVSLKLQSSGLGRRSASIDTLCKGGKKEGCDELSMAILVNVDVS
jgi:hypothetical protein